MRTVMGRESADEGGSTVLGMYMNTVVLVDKYTGCVTVTRSHPKISVAFPAG